MKRNKKSRKTNLLAAIKIVVAMALICVMLLLSACSQNQTVKIDGLPIVGDFAPKGEIFVEVDTTSVSKDVVPEARAYAFEEGDWNQLERFEMELTIPKKYTASGEKDGHDISLPIQYFIHNKKTYAYLNVDTKTEQKLMGVQTFPIVGNESCILIQQLDVFEPLCVNLKTGEITFVLNTDKSSSSHIYCVSETQPYAAVMKMRTNETVTDGYIVDLTNFDAKKILLPGYESMDGVQEIYPQQFVDSRLYVWYRLIEHDENGDQKEGTVVCDAKKGTVEKFDENLSYYTDCQYPHIKMNVDQDTGAVRVLNLKNGADYTYSMQPSAKLDMFGSLDESGRFLLSQYKQKAIENDEDKTVSENTSEPYTPIFIDLEKGKIIDITKYIKDFTISQYKGYNVTAKYWADETHLLITYEKENVHYTDILDLKSAMN